MTLNTIVDIAKQFYILMKPEEDMNFRNQREQLIIDQKDIERVLKIFCSHQKNS